MNLLRYFKFRAKRGRESFSIYAESIVEFPRTLALPWVRNDPRRCLTGLLKERYQAGGGSITVKLIPGEGHKVSPSVFDCQDLVDFVLAQTRDRE